MDAAIINLIYKINHSTEDYKEFGCLYPSFKKEMNKMIKFPEEMEEYEKRDLVEGKKNYLKKFIFEDRESFQDILDVIKDLLFKVGVELDIMDIFNEAIDKNNVLVVSYMLDNLKIDFSTQMIYGRICNLEIIKKLEEKFPKEIKVLSCPLFSNGFSKGNFDIVEYILSKYHIEEEKITKLMAEKFIQGQVRSFDMYNKILEKYPNILESVQDFSIDFSKEEIDIVKTLVYHGYGKKILISCVHDYDFVEANKIYFGLNEYLGELSLKDSEKIWGEKP